ncbi:MAG: DUF4339 domain-containing protein [Burkholderiales bacterium]|nr:DUF4339 domain-containing protein [Phycisphaerae bacterium]
MTGCFLTQSAQQGTQLQYYFSNDGSNQQGPADLDGLRQSGITRATLVWQEGMTDWKPAGDVAELASLFEPVTTYIPDANLAPAAPEIEYHTPDLQAGANGMAIASLVLGIIAMMTWCAWCIGFVPAVLAIVFGHIARGQIRRGQGNGDGMALAGLIMGYIAGSLVVAMISFGIFSAFTSSAANFAAPVPVAPVPAPVMPLMPPMPRQP